ncbi:hypothetical protein K470DRAFT_265358 [Piedraia hortae CBS 480.64]|uniref:LisH domain-containing protein n=1 Tax=Piedraia hortae CBS 480.64 TaxID=1314780 RepID=A0A6A7BVX5_9PEZI|nr:hypothetical protein K470DRAFT_265358 [Piedraia hortae CBS 480.64]
MLGAPRDMNHPIGLDAVKRLNTAIYDHLLHLKLFNVAREFINSGIDVDVDQKKSSPRKGTANGEIDANPRPDDLPEPVQLGDGPFLQDWWCQFWEMYQAQRAPNRTNPNMLSYISAQRRMQKQRQLLTGPPPGIQHMYSPAAVPMGQPMTMADVKPVPARDLMPYQAQIQRARAGAAAATAMERQGSQMDARPRSGSPAGDAPSPKRQRLEGVMQRAGSGGRAPNGQMRTSVPGSQGSPMAPGGDASDFYSANSARQFPTHVSGNHALMDYQVQLMLLERQNKKRLLMARQDYEPGANGHFASGSPSSHGAPSPVPADMSRHTPQLVKPGTSPSAADLGPRTSPLPVDRRIQLPPNMRPHSGMPAGLTPEQVAMYQRHQSMNWQASQSAPPTIMPQQSVAPPTITPRPNNMPPPPPPGQHHAMQPGSPAQPAPKATKNGGKKNDGKKVSISTKRKRKTHITQPPISRKSTANASDSELPTHTPPTPITPMHQQTAFQQNKQAANGQPQPQQLGGAPRTQSQPSQPSQHQQSQQIHPQAQNQPQPASQQSQQQQQQLQPQQQPQPQPQPQQQQQPQPQPQQQQQQQQQPQQSHQQQAAAAAAAGTMDFGFMDTSQFDSIDFPTLHEDDPLDNFNFDTFLTEGDTEGLSFDANFAFGDAAGLDNGMLDLEN